MSFVVGTTLKGVYSNYDDWSRLTTYDFTVTRVTKTNVWLRDNVKQLDPNGRGEASEYHPDGEGPVERHRIKHSVYPGSPDYIHPWGPLHDSLTAEIGGAA